MLKQLFIVTNKYACIKSATDNHGYEKHDNFKSTDRLFWRL